MLLWSVAWLNSQCFGRWSEHIKHVFWDGGQLFKLDFTRFLHVFLTAFSVVITYVTISPINTLLTLTISHTIISHSLLLFLLQQQCFSIVGLDKCQEVVILMKIYDTFCNLFCKLSRKKPRVNWILSIHALSILLDLIVQENDSRHGAKMENKQQSATRQK